MLPNISLKKMNEIYIPTKPLPFKISKQAGTSTKFRLLVLSLSTPAKIRGTEDTVGNFVRVEELSLEVG